jgi:hypothetical protein
MADSPETPNSAGDGSGLRPATRPVETGSGNDGVTTVPTREATDSVAALPNKTPKPSAKRPAATAVGRRAANPGPQATTLLSALPPVTPRVAGNDRGGVSRLRPEIWKRGREAGLAFVDGIEAGAERVASIQDRLAEATQMPVLASVIRTQADLTREVSHAYARTTRGLLRR